MVAQIKARTKDKSFAGLKGNQKKKEKPKNEVPVPIQLTHYVKSKY